MRKLVISLVLLAACTSHIPERARIEAITASAGALAEDRVRPPVGVERVAWLGGCWEAQGPALIVEEYWMPPRGGTMVGMSRTVRGDSTISHEIMLIRGHDSRLALDAHPSGQALTRFMSGPVSDTIVEFENRAHDFPQRIRYQRTGADSLLAQIAGPRAGRGERVVNFHMARAACPAR